jgi:hypothetical protein
MQLALRKFVSPSADLAIRLETVDGSGNPTGTLVNANATATVTAASLFNLDFNPIAVDAHNLSLS